MTGQERTNPRLIDPSRRRRIAAGAGVPQNEVSDLVKQFDGMASMMKQMAGKGMGERMKMVRDLQQGGMQPGGRIAKTKQNTGKRLTASQKKKLKKDRDRELRRRKRSPVESNNKSGKPPHSGVISNT